MDQQQMESGVRGFSIVFPVLLNLSVTVSPGEPHRGLLVINLEGGGPDVGGDGAAQMISLEDLLTRLAEAASMAETGRKGPPPASKASIAAMEEVEAAAVAEGEECPVCLEGLVEEEAEPARAMPCKHRFHGECIRKWLEMHGSCPVCRFQMPAEEEKEGTKKAAEEAVSEGDRGADES